jgi:branched-subunit amino acid transport protein AzlD
MSTMQSKVVGAGLFFLFVFLSGFWLSNSGKPLNSLILTVHKLIAVAAFIFLAVAAYRANQVNPLSTTELAAIAVTAVLFLGTIATGGLLSIGKEMPEAVLRLHQITPYLTVLSTVWLLWSVLPAQESLIP